MKMELARTNIETKMAVGYSQPRITMDTTALQRKRGGGPNNTVRRDFEEEMGKT